MVYGWPGREHAGFRFAQVHGACIRGILVFFFFFFLLLLFPSLLLFVFHLSSELLLLSIVEVSVSTFASSKIVSPAQEDISLI